MCIILRQITQLLFKTLNISLNLLDVELAQILRALGKDNHFITRDLDVANIHGKCMADPPYRLITDGDESGLDGADLVCVVRRDAKTPSVDGMETNAASASYALCSGHTMRACATPSLRPHLCGALAHVIDGARIAERLLGQIVALAVDNGCEGADGVGNANVHAGVSGELLCDVEGLRQELLQLARAVDRESLLVRKARPYPKWR